jgi:hypothetical protein
MDVQIEYVITPLQQQPRGLQDGEEGKRIKCGVEYDNELMQLMTIHDIDMIVYASE